MRSSSRGRDLGPGARGTVLATVLAAMLFFTVAATGAEERAGGVPDVALVSVSVLFAVLLLLPRRFPLFELLRSLDPTVGAGLLGLSLFLPFVQNAFFASDGVSLPTWAAFAQVALLLAVWRFQHFRIDGRDHYFLLAAGLFVVLMGTAGPGKEEAFPFLCLFAVAVVVDLVLLHLLLEEQRILDLARVRGLDREIAEEVSGRGAALPSTMTTALTLIAVGLVASGLLLAWASPRAAVGVRFAWRYFVEGEAGEGQPELPEAGEGIPPFAIPRGVVGIYPFGSRLERDEFARRLAWDALALLVRPKSRSMGPVGSTLVRGECYDYLTEDGRWIRARAREWIVADLADGVSDRAITFKRTPSGMGTTLDYLVPPGPDRTIYARPEPAVLSFRSVAMDGVGTLMVPGTRSPAGRYRIVSLTPEVQDIAPCASPGPEFLRLPPDLDRETLATLVRPRIRELATDYEIALTIESWLRERCLHLEGDAPPDAVEKAPPPQRIDVMGFLTERKWGGNLDFASAYAALLRSVGIPCRLATGYSGGDWLEDAGFRVFRGHHVSAWVEIPFDGVGWVRFDPTPPALDDLSDEALEDIFQKPPEERQAEAEDALAEAGRPTLIRRLLDRIDKFFSSLFPGGRTSSPLGRVMAWVVLLFGATIILRTILFVADRGQGFIRKRVDQPVAHRLTPFYDRLLKLLARHGMRRRRSQTPMEFAREVISTWGRELDDVRRLTNAFCAHRYGELALSRKAAGELTKRVARLDEFLKARAKLLRREMKARRSGPLPAAVALLFVILLGAPLLAQAPGELAERLGDPDPEVRAVAREGLEALGERALPALRAVLEEQNPLLLEKRIARLIRQLDADDYGERERATEELKAIGLPARDALRLVTREGTPEASRRSVAILLYMDRRRGATVANREMRERLMRHHALDLLGALGAGAEADVVAQAGLAFSEHVRDARHALARIAARRLPVVLALLDRPDRRMKILVTRALGHAQIEAARPRLLLLLKERDSAIRKAAREALITAKVVEKTDRARLLMVAGPDEAEAILREVLSLAPGYSEAGVLFVSLLEKKGEHREALAIAEELDMPPEEIALLASRLLAALDDREAALTRLRDRSSDLSKDARALRLAARILLEAEPPRIQQAIGLADEATREAPQDPEPWALLGWIYGEFEGDGLRAYHCYVEALLRDPGNRQYLSLMKQYAPK